MGRAAYVIAGDLIASRKAPQRTLLTRRFERELAALAKEYSALWIVPPVTTRGIDEISCVLRQPEPAFDVAVRLNLALWPQRFRVALASGEIDVAMDNGDAAMMDGPAFHLAADALNRGRAEALDFVIALPPRERGECAVVEALAHLHGAMMQGWTEGTARVVQAYESQGTQTKAAVALGISQQSVSEAIRRGKWKDLKLAQSAIRDWLRGFGAVGNG